MKLRKLFLPLLLFVLAFTLRTYKLHNALGDWHSWRQADTASVAREYVKHGIDLSTPKYMDLSSIPSGQDNPEGYRMVEFPIMNALHAQMYQAFPSVGFVEWGRLISAFSSSLTTVLIFLLVAHLTSKTAAFFASLVYAVMPFSVYYGRVILPEPHLALFMTASLYFFVKYMDSSKWHNLVLTLTTLTLAVLMKPTALVVLLPMYGYALVSGKPSLKKLFTSLALPVLAIIPYALWRRHIASFPEGIPASDWLFNGNGIRFKGAWFHWLFGERIAKLILGYWGLIPFGLGIASLGKTKKEIMVYGGLLLGSLSYLVIVATGNVQHDYYQAQIMPTIAIVSGVGFSYLLNMGKGLKKLYLIGFSIFILLLSVALSWYEIRGYFWVNNSAMVEAGQELDKIAPSDALVIAPYMGDTAFLFQTNRRGWPIGGSIEDKIKKGATYYVTTTKDDEYNELIKKYELVKDTDEYSIIKLKKD